MTREHVFRGSVSSEHIVHFFDDDRARVDTVSTFLAGALNRAGSVLVVAEPHHWSGIAEALGPRAIVSPDARAIVLDARSTLNELLRDGSVERSLFRATITPLVRSLASVSPIPVTIYGEMVDLLAAEGDFGGVQQLEDCWNELAAQESIMLLCGYGSARFAIGQRRELAAICDAHSRVHTDASDALGHWLVHNASRATTSS